MLETIANRLLLELDRKINGTSFMAIDAKERRLYVDLLYFLGALEDSRYVPRVESK